MVLNLKNIYNLQIARFDKLTPGIGNKFRRNGPFKLHFNYLQITIESNLKYLEITIGGNFNYLQIAIEGNFNYLKITIEDNFNYLQITIAGNMRSTLISLKEILIQSFIDSKWELGSTRIEMCFRFLPKTNLSFDKRWKPFSLFVHFQPFSK